MSWSIGPSLAAGGLGRWRGAAYLEASFDAGGLLFVAKTRPVQRRATVRVATSEQLVALELPSTDGGKLGILDRGNVAILEGGVVVYRRPGARSASAWMPGSAATKTYWAS